MLAWLRRWLDDAPPRMFDLRRLDTGESVWQSTNARDAENAAMRWAAKCEAPIEVLTPQGKRRCVASHKPE